MVEENIVIKSVKAGKHEKAKKHEVQEMKTLHEKEKFISQQWPNEIFKTKSEIREEEQEQKSL